MAADVLMRISGAEMKKTFRRSGRRRSSVGLEKALESLDIRFWNNKNPILFSVIANVVPNIHRGSEANNLVLR